MRFSVLVSGSRANSTYLESGRTRILIDNGLSGRQLEQRLCSIGVDPGSLDALLVTHEHQDHIRGIGVLSRRYRLPVYVNEETAGSLERPHGVELFKTGERFVLGDMEIIPTSIVHDALDPVGFRIEGAGLSFGYFTDLGRVTNLVREALASCHSVVLESNHDRDLLFTCDYPWELKQRIASSHGHLSNSEAAKLLDEINHSDLRNVVLGHLSENSNTEKHALSEVKRVIRNHSFSLMCGNPYTATPLLEVEECYQQTAA